MPVLQLGEREIRPVHCRWPYKPCHYGVRALLRRSLLVLRVSRVVISEPSAASCACRPVVISAVFKFFFYLHQKGMNIIVFYYLSISV